jgi:hypothetical protein
MSWEDQGRQEHGWFGHGTAPLRDKQAEGGGGVGASAGITRRIEAVASGTIAASPAGLRRRAEAQFIGSNLARLTSAMAAWNAGARLSPAEFAQRYFARGPDDPAVQHLRAATIGAAEARSHADLRDAAEALGAAVQTIGVDSWPRFIADAEARTRGIASSANDQKPIGSVKTGSEASPIRPEQVPPITATGSTLAFVGGLGDSGSGLIKGAYDAYKKPDGSVAYFAFDQADALAAFIKASNGDVTVVAHSYGADTAAKVVAAGNQVRQLITLDPVSRIRPDYAKVAANASQWIDFNAVGGHSSDFSNFVAGLGGAWGNAPAGFADQLFVVDASHARVGGADFISSWLRYRGK